MLPTSPLHVVIAGGGIAALETTMALRDLAEDRVRITLVAPEPDFELKPLRTAEPFARDHVRRYPLADLAERFGAGLLPTGLAGVDAERYVVRLTDGGELAYDALVLAVGACPRPAYDRVLTFGGDARTEVLNALLADLEEHYTRSVAFVVPPGASWSLPLYELALMTAHQVWAAGIDDARIDVVTPEATPLAIFGAEASDAVAAMLDQAGIAFHGHAYAEVEGDAIALRPGLERVRADRVVALPVLEGPEVPGVPADEHGFIPIDEHGRVRGLTDVYAAGDAADFPVKQGGLACQQADAIAEHIAARAGAPVDPQPFRPVLRGKLLTARGSRYLRHALHGGAGQGRVADFSLWFPPTKVSGRYLSQYLPHLEEQPVGEPHIDVEVPLPGPYIAGRLAMTLDPYSPRRGLERTRGGSWRG
ncbi:MAG TPA: FAD-dependent oxidoreductase [Solirubrobacteraceae bacterium]|jgi:sulfide:quinone oxidoreductase